MIRYCQLNFPANLNNLSADLHNLNSVDWNLHMNTAHYQGDWNILSLIAPGGKNIPYPDALNKEKFLPTPLLDQTPEIGKILSHFKCPLHSVRLMKLHAGASILRHRDVELSFEHGEARLHIPLQTNSDVKFILDDERLPMQIGECWYINANLYHSVQNSGETDRIHLVIDCEVNPWLTELFADPVKISSKDEETDPALARSIIESLYLLGSETSLRLAKEMEDQLNARNIAR
ncbi:aspartyl/asparaginyl beta-hydroxylase domain-containing protein [Dyadobacter sp. LHD-138]|uniref:aspartyl/asparaginyl beta-hydroxylase domain-containing protein n=1 Tax=Dyadobacter sp. LHD-138 TaxID=3071413 RepID=UPI0027E1FFA1|nr:aspartyl/asparaginyl beta-hydroxylase domain-containing protein [Dyadobacter sp. LHD-138]MDQ6477213.1 aspartyl/asparaginyl beta-hydroxylase domain-containing protein [Dyadobacter sp. LHD-138]